MESLSFTSLVDKYLREDVMKVGDILVFTDYESEFFVIDSRHPEDLVILSGEELDEEEDYEVIVPSEEDKDEECTHGVFIYTDWEAVYKFFIKTIK